MVNFIIHCDFYRPAVVEKICELFSLVPSLEVKTPEFEVSMSKGQG